MNVGCSQLAPSARTEPKWRGQPDFRENLSYLFDAPTMIIQGQSAGIPHFRKLPDVLNRENFSAAEIVPFTPFLNPFFRPEEQHRRSGKDQVIVPAGEGNGEMDE
jgi:hypothetical protein